MTTREYITELVHRIKVRYHISSVFMDMEDVVRTVGGRIEERADFDSLCEGSVAKVGNSFIIAIDIHQSKRQREFDLARALGHVFLHMGFQTNSDVWNRLKEGEFQLYSVEAEYQANEFAWALQKQ